VGSVNITEPRTVTDTGVGRPQLALAFAAVRARLGLVILLFGLAAVGWWSTADRMAGMDAGPGADLGALGWFLGVWVVMMAAMMLPSLAPTTALYARMTRQRGLSRPLLFTGGYLLIWGAAGLGAYGLVRAGSSVFGGDLAWHAGGRWFAGGVLALAAAYELTPLKDVCLTKCRSPLGFLLGAWRDGPVGALQMGSRHAGWCVGCCWALMAALIAFEKTLPWRGPAIWGTAGVLMVLAIMVLAVPQEVPGLVLPSGGQHAMRSMTMMP
jgi:hypothetical protein